MPRFPCPSVRRERLGPPRPFDGEAAGSIVCVAGYLEAGGQMVAESVVARSGLLVWERSAGPVRLRLADEAALLVDGPIAVVVGTHEDERPLPPHGRVSLRQLTGGSLVRARGRIRRVDATTTGYRDAATVWALCATGPTDTVDMAVEVAPRGSIASSTTWDRLTRAGVPAPPRMA